MDNEQEIKKLIMQFGNRAMQQFQEENVDTLTARMADNYLSMLSGFSAQLEQMLGELEIQEAKEWVAFRELYKTNEEAKRNWKATEAGIEQIRTTRLLKATDKIISACKRRLDRIKQEAYNQV